MGKGVGSAYLAEITNWGRGSCNSLNSLAFPKFQLIGGAVVIVGLVRGEGELKIRDLEHSNPIGKV